MKNKEDEIVINASVKHNLKTESFVISQNKYVFRNKEFWSFETGP